MVDGYIRKQDASDAVIKHLQLDYEYAWGAREAINALTSADVVPVVHGYWFVDERPESDREVICSVCEEPVFRYHDHIDWRPKYCPHCGAKMDAYCPH